jgi:hypothetical protein
MIATLGLALTLATTACQSAPAAPARAPAKKAAPARSPNNEARDTLARYLRLALAGRHAEAWSLLTEADQAKQPLADYVATQQSNDRLSRQIAALGKTRFTIVRLRAAGDTAKATVELRSGLGASEETFVLRKERTGWRVDFDASWQ